MSLSCLAGVSLWEKRLARVVGVILAALVSCAPLQTSADTSVDSVALTLSRGPGGETLELSLTQLSDLPQVTVVTENEFSNGLVAYRGPLARDVLDQLSLMQFKALRFVAANDYYVEIPTEDFRRYNVIFAMQADGVPLARREKGPLWLMYPISEYDELSDPIYIHRLIWQVVRVEPS